MDLFDELSTNDIITPLFSKKGHFVVDDSLGVSLLLSLFYQKKEEPILVVASNLYKAQQIVSFLSSFLKSDSVLLFPSDELIRAENMIQSKEMVSHRLFVLHKILNKEARIVVTNIASATRYLPNKDLFNEKVLDFKVGSSYNLQDIKKNLSQNGYYQVNKIDQSLQYAVRGDILDIYSVNYEHPVRVEFFGDEIETIRFFDIATQRSIQNIESVTILPANDILFTEKELTNAQDKILDRLEKDKNRLKLGDFEKLRDNTILDLDRLISGEINQKLYKYYSLITESHYSLFDYCEDYLKVFVSIDSIKTSNKMLIDESLNYLLELQEDHSLISGLSMYQDLNVLTSFKGKNIITTSELLQSSDDYVFDIRTIPYQASRKEDCLNIIQNYLNDEYKIIVSLDKSEHINLVQEGLTKLGFVYENIHDLTIPKGKIAFTHFYIPRGFILPNNKIVYLTSFELFNDRIRTSRFDNRFKEATILRSFEDLEAGDYVVHEYQGIGQFLELTTLEVDGVHRDYLKIAFHAGELLYVPLSQFQLVRKYLGKEGIKPRLSRLHTKDWENTKRKIKERINELANRLMNLYIERSKVKGFAFAKDDEFQNEFESYFPYELTSDQSKALKEIKEEMESSSPMDRLLCGDVGFGKTEVAFRVAFKAINSGKQVVILCPTTLLARQHYELALERFSQFDVKIALFSRLVSTTKQKEYIKEIKEGKVHLIIGTHRLLSKEISYKDLGLLIVDEEQRFGVEQKERLKELKTNIDVLTLTATPIPRTLQISLLGVRSMSIINTAPKARMPIQTYVTPFNEQVTKELIERELGRNGQVFYLHNNISSLFIRANRLSKLLPSASIGVIHGQMEKEQIEDTMSSFYNGEINVLVCTSIVENGIDIPNANMIIIEDSEMYGLSQLYQIKGRVGRSDRIAYAYLMYSPNKILNEKAQKRLKAIQDFTELGSGYKIAQRDLMIRGAGDVLGSEQAGFIDSIGLDMYIKLLNEAVKEKMEGKTVSSNPSVNPSLAIEAYIPSSFASDSDKIELYQEILSAPSKDDLYYIKMKTIDVFGKLPSEVEMIFKKRKIDLLVKEACVESIHDTNRYIEMILGEPYIKIRGIGNMLFQAIIPFLNKVKISYLNNRFKIVMQKDDKWLDDLEDVLNTFLNILKNNKVVELS